MRWVLRLGFGNHVAQRALTHPTRTLLRPCPRLLSQRPPQEDPEEAKGRRFVLYVVAAAIPVVTLGTWLTSEPAVVPPDVTPNATRE